MRIEIGRNENDSLPGVPIGQVSCRTPFLCNGALFMRLPSQSIARAASQYLTEDVQQYEHELRTHAKAFGNFLSGRDLCVILSLSAGSIRFASVTERVVPVEDAVTRVPEWARGALRHNGSCPGAEE